MSRKQRFLLMSVITLALLPGSAMPAGPYRFYSVAPCRIVDTRNPTGPTGGPILTAGIPRHFPIAGQCSVPPSATAAVLNFAVITPAAGGFITAWPFGTPQPTASTLNYDTGDIVLANGAVIPLTTGASSISVVSMATADLVIDVTGYYQ